MTETPPGGVDLPQIALEEMISRTNLSEVWRGRRRVDGAPVAVKFALSPAGAAALEPEADTVHALQAGGVPGIVPTDYFTQPVPHLVLPWMGRRTFRDTVSGLQGGDDRSRATRVLLQVVETVAGVHREGFLHGDLKPENILIDERGRPWVTDFGMARAIRTARLDTRVSQSMSQDEGGWGGTLHYLPPEGLHGEPPTPSWDVYAIGVMLHEILLGHRPDRAATPESLRAVLPGAVVDLLLGALAYSPADRIPNVPRLLTLIHPIRSELTLTGPARWARRVGRLCLAGLAAFFVALRYASVVALLLTYVAILLGGVFGPTGVLVALAPFLILHMVVRWEGPETPEEAKHRGQGGVVTRRLRAPAHPR